METKTIRAGRSPEPPVQPITMKSSGGAVTDGATTDLVACRKNMGEGVVYTVDEVFLRAKVDLQIQCFKLQLADGQCSSLQKQAHFGGAETVQ